MTNDQSDRMNMEDIAVQTGLAYSTIVNMRAIGKLPDPDIDEGRSPLWYRDTIDRWDRARTQRVKR